MGSPQMNMLASMDYSTAINPPALTLDQCGVIQDCTDAIEKLFGFSRNELVQHHISHLLPQLSEIKLLNDGRLNSRIIFLAHCGHLFKAQARDGAEFFSELFFSQLGYGQKQTLRLIVRPSDYARC
jgi:PAS domain S-box-containing protein